MHAYPDHIRHLHLLGSGLMLNAGGVDRKNALCCGLGEASVCASPMRRGCIQGSASVTRLVAFAPSCSFTCSTPVLPAVGPLPLPPSPPTRPAPARGPVPLVRVSSCFCVDCKGWRPSPSARARAAAGPWPRLDERAMVDIELLDLTGDGAARWGVTEDGPGY